MCRRDADIRDAGRPARRRRNRWRSWAASLWMIGFAFLAVFLGWPPRDAKPGQLALAERTETARLALAEHSGTARLVSAERSETGQLALAERAETGWLVPAGSVAPCEVAWSQREKPRRIEYRNIEDIRPGDRVVAWDEAAGRTVVRPVVRLFANRSDHLRSNRSHPGKQ